MNYSDKLALIREYKSQGGKGSYLSLLKSYEKGGNLPQYDGEGDSQLPVRNFTAESDNTQYSQQVNGNIDIKNFPQFGGTLAPVEIRPSNIPYRNDVASRREDIKKIPITKTNMKEYPVATQREFMKQQVADRPDYEGVKDFANFAATGFGIAPIGIVDEAINGAVGLGKKYITKMLKRVDNAAATPAFKSEIDWAKWNKEIPENKSLMQEYNAIEQQNKANGTWMKNSDGSEFKGTPQEFIIENSKQFKKSFPYGHEVVYKGVGVNGKMDNIIPTTKYDYMQPFFAGDEIIANKFTSQYHNSKSPYISHNTKFNAEANPEVYKFYIPKDENPIVIDLNKQNWGNFKLPKTSISGDERYQIMRTALGDETSTGAIQKYIKDNNINYIKLLNTVEKGNSTLGTDYIINPRNNFFPKSAIGNNGMFDMTNPNIYKALLPLGTGLPAILENVEKEKPNKRKK